MTLPCVKNILSDHHTAVRLQLFIGHVFVAVIVIGKTVRFAVAVRPPIEHILGKMLVERGRPFIRESIYVVNIPLLREAGDRFRARRGNGNDVGKPAGNKRRQLGAVVRNRRHELHRDAGLFFDLAYYVVFRRNRPAGNVHIPLYRRFLARVQILPAVFVGGRFFVIGIRELRHIVLVVADVVRSAAARRACRQQNTNPE